MPSKGQLDFRRRDALTVVGHDDPLCATTFDFHTDVARFGVQRVFDQLFDD